mmetsp:Transcript_33116/g.65568  ORF Transcript_33116/g.65568 Transcript_33116/m.65568 type:complete len:207 (-) Transcript_33116:497-1117(-)
MITHYFYNYAWAGTSLSFLLNNGRVYNHCLYNREIKLGGRIKRIIHRHIHGEHCFGEPRELVFIVPVEDSTHLAILDFHPIHNLIKLLRMFLVHVFCHCIGHCVQLIGIQINFTIQFHNRTVGVVVFFISHKNRRSAECFVHLHFEIPIVAGSHGIPFGQRLGHAAHHVKLVLRRKFLHGISILSAAHSLVKCYMLAGFYYLAVLI